MATAEVLWLLQFTFILKFGKETFHILAVIICHVYMCSLMLYDKWKWQHKRECVQVRPDKSVLCVTCWAVLASVTVLSIPPYDSVWYRLWSGTWHNVSASTQSCVVYSVWAESRVPYFLAYSAHLTYNAHPKLLSGLHDIWCRNSLQKCVYQVWVLQQPVHKINILPYFPAYSAHLTH
jgi:hypothetical protein